MSQWDRLAERRTERRAWASYDEQRTGRRWQRAVRKLGKALVALQHAKLLVSGGAHGMRMAMSALILLILVAAGVATGGALSTFNPAVAQSTSRDCVDAADWWTNTRPRIDSTWLMVERGLTLLMWGAPMPNTFTEYGQTLAIFSSAQSGIAPTAADTAGLAKDVRDLFYWWGQAFDTQMAPMFRQTGVSNGLAALDRIAYERKIFTAACGLPDE